jgi:hypothetical protein
MEAAIRPVLQSIVEQCLHSGVHVSPPSFLYFFIRRSHPAIRISYIIALHSQDIITMQQLPDVTLHRYHSKLPHAIIAVSKITHNNDNQQSID